MHYKRWKANGDPAMTRRGLAGTEHPGWKGDNCGYDAAHMRVKKLYGSARNHPCAQGCGAMATGWSYTYDCPRELEVEMIDNRTGAVRKMRYSPDPDRYEALCHSCHTSKDRLWALSR